MRAFLNLGLIRSLHPGRTCHGEVRPSLVPLRATVVYLIAYFPGLLHIEELPPADNEVDGYTLSDHAGFPNRRLITRGIYLPPNDWIV